MKVAASAVFHKPKKVEEFRAFLAARGCDVLTPTNPFEVVRFRAAGVVNVVYKRNSGVLTVVGPHVEPAIDAFTSAGAWRADPKPTRPGKRRKSSLLTTLEARDGPDCFYCGKPLYADTTIEHMVGVSQKGPNNAANCVLAHAACNSRAGHLSVAEKVRLRDQMRSAEP